MGIMFRHCKRLSSENTEFENTGLSDNAQTLPELPDPTQVAVAGLPHGDVKLGLPCSGVSAAATRPHFVVSVI